MAELNRVKHFMVEFGAKSYFYLKSPEHLAIKNRGVVVMQRDVIRLTGIDLATDLDGLGDIPKNARVIG